MVLRKSELYKQVSVVVILQLLFENEGGLRLSVFMASPEAAWSSSDGCVSQMARHSGLEQLNRAV